MQGFDGLRERDGPALGDRGALFRLVRETGMAGGLTARR
jgi:hypothetical protein